MIKLMLKKELEELLSRLLRRNTSKRKFSTTNVVLYAGLFLFLVVYLGVSVYLMTGALCGPLYDGGMPAYYFALMGIMATIMGTTGSIFVAYPTLYRARDNELLLSMPIKPGAILFARMTVIYLMGFGLSAAVWLPVAMRWFSVAGFGFRSVVAVVVTGLLLPLLSAVLACALGYGVAWLRARIRHSAVVTAVLSLGLVAGIFALQGKIYGVLASPATVAELFAGKSGVFLRPFTLLGLAAVGNPGELMLFTLLALALFGLVYGLLSVSFIRLATHRKAATTVAYKDRQIRGASPDGALLGKEFARLLSCPVYLLNCALGSLVLLIAAVAAILQGETLRSLLGQYLTEETVALLIPAAVSTVSAMNSLTAPSVSLEGDRLYLLQSFPVSPQQVLKAKLRLQLLVSGIPATICALTLTTLMGLKLVYWVLIPLLCGGFVWLCAAFGLCANLWFPNLSWSNETVPVKQGLSTALAIFVPWGVLALLCGGYFVLAPVSPGAGYLVLAAAVIGALAVGLCRYLMTAGARRFSALSP